MKRVIDEISVYMLAVKNGDLEKFKRLFARNEGSKKLLEECLPCMAEAIKLDRYTIFEFLFNNGVDIGALDNRTLSLAISMGIKFKDTRLVKLIVENYRDAIDIKIKDNLERTPLNYAILANDFDLVTYLIEHGAKTDKWTTLSYAIMNECFNSARALIESGVKITKEDIYWTGVKAHKSRCGVKEALEFYKYMKNKVKQGNLQAVRTCEQSGNEAE